MTDNEIVKALRICNRTKGHRCSECPVFSRYEHRICKKTVDMSAADLIESLQNKIFKYVALSESLKKECGRLMTLNDELKVRLADTNARNERLSNDYSAYSGSALEHADELIESLESQLSASQARERAAVEDLNGTGACFTCKHFRRNGGDCFGAGRCRLDGIEIWPCNEPGVYRVEVPDDGRKTYEWRGPQAGEEQKQA